MQILLIPVFLPTSLLAATVFSVSYLGLLALTSSNEVANA